MDSQGYLHRVALLAGSETCDPEASSCGTLRDVLSLDQRLRQEDFSVDKCINPPLRHFVDAYLCQTAALVHSKTEILFFYWSGDAFEEKGEMILLFFDPKSGCSQNLTLSSVISTLARNASSSTFIFIILDGCRQKIIKKLTGDVPVQLECPEGRQVCFMFACDPSRNSRDGFSPLVGAMMNHLFEQVPVHQALQNVEKDASLKTLLRCGDSASLKQHAWLHHNFSRDLQAGNILISKRKAQKDELAKVQHSKADIDFLKKAKKRSDDILSKVTRERDEYKSEVEKLVQLNEQLAQDLYVWLIKGKTEIEERLASSRRLVASKTCVLQEKEKELRLSCESIKEQADKAADRAGAKVPGNIDSLGEDNPWSFVGDVHLILSRRHAEDCKKKEISMLKVLRDVTDKREQVNEAARQMKSVAEELACCEQKLEENRLQFEMLHEQVQLVHARHLHEKECLNKCILQGKILLSRGMSSVRSIHTRSAVLTSTFLVWLTAVRCLTKTRRNRRSPTRMSPTRRWLASIAEHEAHDGLTSIAEHEALDQPDLLHKGEAACQSIFVGHARFIVWSSFNAWQRISKRKHLVDRVVRRMEVLFALKQSNQAQHSKFIARACFNAWQHATSAEQDSFNLHFQSCPILSKSKGRGTSNKVNTLYSNSKRLQLTGA